MATYEEALKTWRPDQWRTFGEQGGTIGADDSLVGGGITANPINSYLDKKGMLGLTNHQWGDVEQLTGLAGAFDKLYESQWGNQAKLFKEQLGMLKEQRAANQEMLANKRKFNETWSNASNGLASRYAQPQVG